jgi:hypothetical protein
VTEIGQVAIAVAFLAAIPPTLVGWAALRSSRKNAEKTDTIIGKADQIHSLTNSQLSATVSALAVANEKIAGLEKMVSQLATDAPRRRTRPSRESR